MVVVNQSQVFRTRACNIYYLEWLEQTKNINPFKKSTGKQFND